MEASESRIRGSELYPVLFVFVIAFAIRLIYFFQYRNSVFFAHPIGDSSHYHQRALEIVSGDIAGSQAYFLGSPLYPYFLAAVYKLFGTGFTWVHVLQHAIGSATCALVYLLARTVCVERRSPALLAGLMAAGYGTLVFFEGALLMTSLELFFTCAFLLLLVVSQEWYGENDGGRPSPRRRAFAVFASGVLMGLAGIGRPNVLVFAPVCLLWIFTGFGRAFVWRRWRRAVLFALGCILSVSPITLRNYAVSGDFVLVSSSGGINLFIGNNERANGCLSIPDGEGLELSRLFTSSRAAAESATGKAGMKPSEVSRYWMSRAFRYVVEHPASAARLQLRKLRLFWNHYEIPNVLDKYYATATYASSLRWFFVGFGLIVPLAFVGVLLVLRTGIKSKPVRLLLGFIVVYMCSVVPFFVTARYRMPVVPVLIVFASIGVCELAKLVKKRNLVWVGAAVVVGACSGVWANRTVVEGNFWFNRATAGMIYTNLALEKPVEKTQLLDRAIVELKKSIELSPNSIGPHYYLGRALRERGCYSGAIRAFEIAHRLQPSSRQTREALEEARALYERDGDFVDRESLPLTPLEKARKYRREGNTDMAVASLRRALEEDPQHTRAHNELGFIYYERGEYERAVSCYKSALRYSPDNPVLHKNIAEAYYRMADIKNARRHWERCLEIDPTDEFARQKLEDLGDR